MHAFYDCSCALGTSAGQQGRDSGGRGRGQGHGRGRGQAWGANDTDSECDGLTLSAESNSEGKPPEYSDTATSEERDQHDDTDGDVAIDTPRLPTPCTEQEV